MQDPSSIWTQEQSLSALREAREIFGNKFSSKSKYELMQKCLAFVCLYCPEDLKTIAMTTLLESCDRKRFYTLFWEGKNE